MNDFSKNLNFLKNELNYTQLELCAALYDMPHRTLQSWLQNEKLPPIYIQKLVIERLEQIHQLKNDK